MMKSRNWVIVIFVIAILGFGTGYYFKYSYNYLGQNVEVETPDKTKSQASLSEAIAFLEEMKELTEKHSINDSSVVQNELALKRLKTINLVSITGMILTLILGIWSIRQLLRFKSANAN
ncbi:hypothetical protein [uncultured Sunxiuqinia sp.]|uniref:hypothetical protein n=1 Tax=uncultured Sunxiuqinia sp. TaxID=1573825 RepID=UPI00260F4A10|nr:hypothetical protein [uncultured Sunxiuqinia sp.]